MRNGGRNGGRKRKLTNIDLRLIDAWNAKRTDRKWDPPTKQILARFKITTNTLNDAVHRRRAYAGIPKK